MRLFHLLTYFVYFSVLVKTVQCVYMHLCVMHGAFFFFLSNCYELLSGASLAMCTVICSSSTICYHTQYTWCFLCACLCRLTTRCVIADLQSDLCASLFISYHQTLLQGTVILSETLCGNGMHQWMDGEGELESGGELCWMV